MLDWLRYHAATTPDRPALLTTEGAWSFAQMVRCTDESARHLLELGVEPGDRVGLCLANGPQFVILVQALVRLGAVTVLLNNRLTAAEIRWQLEDTTPRLLVYDDANDQQAAEAITRTDVLPCSVHELTAVSGSGDAEPPLRHEIDLSALHSIIYTSGTTGRPKGAMLTYGNHWWSALGSAINLGTHSDDLWLACLPMFHVGGLAIIMRGAIYGVPVMVLPSFDAEVVNRAIDEQGVTLVSLVSTMLCRLLDERGDRPYPPSLRAVLLGGGPAPRDLLQEAARRGVPVLQTYGMTETASQAVTLAPEDALRKLGSAGKPLMPVELRIEAAGEEAPPGTEGEILLRGPNVSPGYWGRPDETARAHRGGWFHTGDVGYLDDEGFLYVLDRRADLIISGGENVYPAEVEAVLMSHPDVYEAGSWGAPDLQWGETVHAAVVPRPGANVTAEELRAYCLERLARYKVPTLLQFVDKLPRNAAGKLLRRALRDRDQPI